jgi:hypothetical protein
MIIDFYCTYVLSGRNFYPSHLKIPNDLKIIQNNEPNDILQYGKYKGKPSEEGILIVEGTLDKILDLAEEILNHDSKQLITYSNLCLIFCYESQCNIELSSSHLQRISILGIPLNITCYENIK